MIIYPRKCSFLTWFLFLLTMIVNKLWLESICKIFIKCIRFSHENQNSFCCPFTYVKIHTFNSPRFKCFDPSWWYQWTADWSGDGIQIPVKLRRLSQQPGALNLICQKWGGDLSAQISYWQISVELYKIVNSESKIIFFGPFEPFLTRRRSKRIAVTSRSWQS